MKYIKRDIEEKIKSLSCEYSCILITGPRQVGKTTVLKHLADENREYVTLDDLEERKLAKNDPALFMQMHSLPIFIDEVQYAPELFSYIKIAADNGAEPGDFWLSGSQAFRLMELAQESLAGRIAVLHMSSLSQHEIYGNGQSTEFSVTIDNLKKRKKTRILLYFTILLNFKMNVLSISKSVRMKHYALCRNFMKGRWLPIPEPMHVFCLLLLPRKSIKTSQVCASIPW